MCHDTHVVKRDLIYMTKKNSIRKQRTYYKLGLAFHFPKLVYFSINFDECFPLFKGFCTEKKSNFFLQKTKEKLTQQWQVNAARLYKKDNNSFEKCFNNFNCFCDYH